MAYQQELDILKDAYHKSDKSTDLLLPQLSIPSLLGKPDLTPKPKLIEIVYENQKNKKPTDSSSVYVGSFSAANRNQGTLTEPIWYFNPRILNLQSIKVLAISIPWLTGVAADPNPFYIIASRSLGILRAFGFLNGRRYNILGYVNNHGIIGNRLTFIDTGSSHTLEMQQSDDNEKTLSALDISIYDPSGALVTPPSDWSVTILFKASPLK